VFARRFTEKYRMEESLSLLIPFSVVLVFVIAWVFWRSVRGGQFDDLEGPGFCILMDDDQPSSVSGKPAGSKPAQPSQQPTLKAEE
jgi:cbb3-type cytochrome oxidase maturation protein